MNDALLLLYYIFVFKWLLFTDFEILEIAITNDVREAYTIINKLKSKEELFALFEKPLLLYS